jgi:2-keto-4-pentenoate hydratase/2-oxohepta-3-ene-1,7-dioic acid hydratase in catechol pathway
MSSSVLKFVTIGLKRAGNGTKNVAGILLPNGDVLDVVKHLRRQGKLKSLDFGGIRNKSMLDFLRAADKRPDLVDDLTSCVYQNYFNTEDLHQDGAYVIRAPIVPDRNVFCIGKNYSDHIAEINRVNSKKDTAATSGAGQVTSKDSITVPVIFTKAPQTIVGHDTAIQSHAAITKWLDYEVELGVVIGRTCVDVSEDKAMENVFGYTIGNDVTARDIQKKHLQWFKGKSLDTSCPLGPYLVHASGVPDPHNLRLRTWINGEIRQDSNTSNLIFKLPRLISELSKGFTLLPGDVILTGTPDGVGYAMEPPRVLRAGDTIQMEIECLGTLRNTVA